MSTTIIERIKKEIESLDTTTHVEEVGTVTAVLDGVAEIEGLQNAQMMEMILFDTGSTKSLAETLDSSDAGICCSAQCAKKAEPITCPATAECKSACGGDEEEQEGATCSNGEVCCALKENGGEKNNTWIIILIILIAIVVILIIFRSKIQLAWYNWRGRVKSSPVTRPGSGGVSSLPVQGFGPRPPFTPGMARPPIRPSTRPAPQAGFRASKDKELEETMKKLREMTK